MSTNNIPTLQQVREYVARGLVSERTHNTLPLSIFKYTQLVQHNYSNWDSVTRFCRGAIYNTETGELVARSYPKFFNLSEPEFSQLEVLPKSDPVIVEKLDGSCIIVFYYKGNWEVATLGSFHSEQAEYVRKHILPKYIDRLDQYAFLRTRANNKPYTFICEAIYPENRIVVDYGDKEALVIHGIFLGAEEGTFQSVQWAAMLIGFECAKVYKKEQVGENFDQFEKNSEGFVLRWEEPNCASVKVTRGKIKSPEYVLAHRALSNLNLENVLEVYLKHDYENFVTDLPEAISSQYDDLLALLIAEKEKVDYAFEAEMRGLKSYIYHMGDSSRKELAAYIKKEMAPEFHYLAFKFLDGQDPYIATKPGKWYSILWGITLERIEKKC